MYCSNALQEEEPVMEKKKSRHCFGGFHVEKLLGL